MRTLTIKLTPQAVCLPLNVLSGPSIFLLRRSQNFSVVNSNEKMFFNHITQVVLMFQMKLFLQEYFGVTTFLQTFVSVISSY